MKQWIMTVLIIGFAAPALAERRAEPEIGDTTRAWLELQRSNNASYAVPRPLPADVADAVYERYLQSFKHPIPRQFARDQGSSEGD